jgi:hypothetical protein
MRRYRIGGEFLDDQGRDFQAVLAAAYEAKSRPLCLCRPEGVPMYIARIGDQHVIKRMPLSGHEHRPDCGSYDPAHDLSGLRPLIGGAIQIDPRDGTATLRADFALTKTGPRTAASSPSDTKADTVRNETRKLSLKALLHYLWQEGGLTEWTAHWADKRHWWHVRSHLIEAAKTMTIKGGGLNEHLFVPEPFRSEDKAVIEQRRAAALAPLRATASPRRLMVLIGEVKEFAQARNGRRLIVKHMPGFPLMLEDRAWRRLQARFETEFGLWGADENAHLIAVATFGLSAAVLANVEEIALMAVTENWIPVESGYEAQLVQRLARLRQKSVKELRFNLPADQPTAVATLPEARPLPMALYLVPPDADEAYDAALSEMIAAHSEMVSWVWRPADGEMPALPAS